MEIIKRAKKGKFNKGREKGWKEDEPKEEIKSYTRHFLKTCCEGDQENIKQKTTRKTDERKTEKRPMNMNTKFFRQSFCFEKKWSVQKKGKKEEKFKFFFWEEEKTKRKRKHKGTILTFKRPTNKKHSQLFFFRKKETAQTETIQKTWLRVKKGK